MGWQDAPVVEDAGGKQPSWMGAPEISDKSPTIPDNSRQSGSPTWYDQLGRQVGLTARAGLSGLAGIPAAAGDIANTAINAVTGGVNAATGTRIPQLQMPSEMVQRGLTAAGLPVPQTGAERVAQAGVSAMAGGGGFATLAGRMASTVANPLAKGVLSMLGQAPTAQAISNATGAMSGQVAANMGAGPVGQAAASLVGGALPSIPALGEVAAKRALRGPDSNIPTMAERMASLKGAGITEPSAGQVTGSRAAQAAESILSKTPGGAGPMVKAAEKQMAEIGKKAEQVADSLSKVSTPELAGAAIEKGISGEGGFIQRFKQAQTALYNKLDEFIPKQRGVDITRTKGVLADMNADIPNAPALSKWFKNAKIQGIEEALKQDTSGKPIVAATPERVSPILQESGKPFTSPGKPAVMPSIPPTQLPYEAVKKLRSLVGAELENPSLASDVPRSKWKALYASLSQDLDDMAVATGNPEAIRAMNRANRFTKAGHDRIDSVLEGVMKSKTPEMMFKNATSSGDLQAGATKIAGVLKSLEPAERDVVKSAFIRRMGMATAGQQNAEGTKFSTDTFLTNWNKVSPEAKRVLFSGKDGEVAKSLDSIAKTAEYIKEGSKVFANPSGTARAIAANTAFTSGAAALFSGHWPIAAGIAGGAYGANISAKMMTNPKFINWLAKSSKMPAEMVPAALQNLARTAKDEPDDVKADIAGYIQSFDNAPDRIRTLQDQMQGAR